VSVAVRDEASFLAEINVLPDDHVVFPGYTAAALREIMVRPAVDPAGSRFVPSVEYSEAAGEVGQMALYVREDPTERAPIVLYAHGGGFHLGHHFTPLRYLHPLAARGYVAASMTYRFRDEGAWPAPIEDAKCAVRWLRRHAGEIGGDPDRIIFAGDSAGALMGLMTALTPGRWEHEGGCHDVSSDVQGLVLLYPPVDLRATAGRDGGSLLDYVGDLVDETSPMNNVHAGCPPVLTMTGSADVLTTEAEIRRFHQALDGLGVQNRLEVFPGAPHVFDWHPDLYRRCLELFIEFADATIGGTGSVP
jgi:acetyl esterase/lipase